MADRKLAAVPPAPPPATDPVRPGSAWWVVAKIFTSRKALALLVAIVVVLARELFHVPISGEGLMELLALIGTYVLAQGIADHGAAGGSQGAEYPAPPESED